MMSRERGNQRHAGDPYSRRLASLVASARTEDFGSATMERARYFLADTLAVGIAGKCNPAAQGVFEAMRKSAPPGTVRCLGRDATMLPAYQAAVVNGFQIHCLEWDGLHEPSVVIALCAPVAAIVCELDAGEYSVGEVLEAFILGVEVAVFFGSAAATAPRFFRPSAAGGIGAAMAVGRLRGYDEGRLLDLLGLAYSQAGGTMQAHWEGSEALALQVGFAARSALTAADLVKHGVSGPHDVVSGRFGYFALFEQAEDLDGVLARWGAPWKIDEVAHKPFPAGRATQAAITAILAIQKEHAFDASEVAGVRAKVPSLIGLLVNRPFSADMTPSYARLCLEYVVARLLLDRTVDPLRFTSEHFAEPEVARLAARVVCVVDNNPDPNALGPQDIAIALDDGRVFARHVEVPLGAPANPLSRKQRIAKIERCLTAGRCDADAGEFMQLCETIPATAPASRIVAALESETVRC